MALLLVRSCLGGALALAMAWRGLRHGSLSHSGAAAAFVVGTLHMACGVQYGALLIAFYLSSSKVTKLGQDRKRKLEADFRVNGQRTAAQVLCNSLGGCVAAVAAAACWAAGPAWQRQHWMAQAAFMGHYACCCGDTWASEVGILSPTPPRLITTGRRVPPGTNGGVTLLGMASSAAAGAAMAACFAACVPPAEQRRLQGLLPCLLPLRPGRLATAVSAAARAWVPLGVAAALLGSALDSLLGATLQYSGRELATGRATGAPGPGVERVSGAHLLSNNAVNAWAAALTSAACGLAAAAVVEGGVLPVFGPAFCRQQQRGL